MDGGGLGLVVSASRAVYASSNGNNQLVAVVGTDVLMSRITSAGSADQAAAVAELISRSAACPSFSLTPCELQRLRSMPVDGWVTEVFTPEAKGECDASSCGKQARCVSLTVSKEVVVVMFRRRARNPLRHTHRSVRNLRQDRVQYRTALQDAGWVGISAHEVHSWR